jgi:hypothetical protein
VIPAISNLEVEASLENGAYNPLHYKQKEAISVAVEILLYTFHVRFFVWRKSWYLPTLVKI